MKILFAIKGLDDAPGGAERVLADVSGGLAARGHEVVVLTYDAPGGRPCYALHSRVRRVALGIGRTDCSATVMETLRRLPALRRAVRRERPDVVVGFMHSVFIPLGLALVGLRVPMVASEHIVYDHYRGRPLERLLLRLTPYLARCITVLSESVRRSYPRVLQRRMTVIHNPVAVGAQEQADVVGAARPRKRLLTVGRLTPQKDHRILIEAFARLAGALSDWDLRIIGEGELRADLERQIERLGLGDRIHLAGATTAIAAEYAGAQVFVMPSRYESFGLATAEALAHGLPAVGFFDCPGTNEVIRDGENGFLVRGADRVGALAEGLRRLMASADERRRLGTNGPASVARYSPERIYDRWEELLRSCVGKRQDFYVARRTQI